MGNHERRIKRNQDKKLNLNKDYAETKSELESLTKSVKNFLRTNIDVVEYMRTNYENSDITNRLVSIYDGLEILRDQISKYNDTVADIDGGIKSTNIADQGLDIIDVSLKIGEARHQFVTLTMDWSREVAKAVIGPDSPEVVELDGIADELSQFTPNIEGK